MLFRRRKTQELNIEDIEKAAQGAEESDYETEDYYEAEEPAEELYDDAGEEFFGEDELYDDPEASLSYDTENAYDEDGYDEAPEPGPHEKLSPVETGAWEYIHGEPNEDYLTDTGNFRYELDGPEGGVFLPDEAEEKAKKPRIVHVRRKHKKHHYLLKFTACVVAVGLLITFMMSSYFDINEIKVEGMTYYTAEQILELSELKLGENIFKTKTGKAENRIEDDPHIAKATIKRDLPKTLVITVEERLPVAQVAFGPEDAVQYAVIDANGYILSVGEEADAAAAMLVGLTVKGEHITAGTDLAVEEGAVYDETLSLIKAAAAQGIAFTWMDMSEKTVKLYFSDTLLIKGKPATILDHINNGDVTLILNDLASKEITTGTINASSEGSFTFSPEAE